MKNLTLWSLKVFAISLVLSVLVDMSLGEESLLYSLTAGSAAVALLLGVLGAAGWGISKVLGGAGRVTGLAGRQIGIGGSTPSVTHDLRFRRTVRDDGVERRALEVYPTGKRTRLNPSDLRPTGGTWDTEFFHCSVAGVSHRHKALQRSDFSLGSSVRVVHEPDNPHSKDGKTLAVFNLKGGHQVGYIPSADSSVIYDRLAKDSGIAAFVQTEFRNDGERVGLRLLLFSSTDVRFSRVTGMR